RRSAEHATTTGRAGDEAGGEAADEAEVGAEGRAADDAEAEGDAGGGDGADVARAISAEWTSVSQGSRSASVRGMPLRIFSMLARGWRASASTKSQFRRVASARPIVDFPLPDTPITTTAMSFVTPPGLPVRDRTPAEEER